MARDRRFVDVFDFKSFLTSRQREGSRVPVLHTHPKRILAIYHEATPQSDRSFCRRGCAGNAQDGRQRSSKARGRPLISAVPHSFRMAINSDENSMAYERHRGQDPAARPPVRRPEILPLPEGPNVDGGSEIVESGSIAGMPTAVIAAYARSSLLSIAGALSLRAWT